MNYHQLQARMAGYADGLTGKDEKAAMYHPDSRFPYRAGHKDGARARQELAERLGKKA